MMQNAIALSARSIVKRFHVPHTFEVLKGVSFDVRRGECLAIMGKSGSGKSTLLYVLSTMDTDYEGSVTINGFETLDRSRRELAAFRNEHIGFVFQFHYLLPEFTVLDNVMLPALKRGRKPTDEIHEDALSLLDTLGVKHLVEKKASMLSGGEQQRVAVARSLINEPAIVLADEPTGNLDSHNSTVIQEMLRGLARERGQTIVTVTHDDDFAARCDRILEMADGAIV
jgi:lipoprotein-releasing system ATP-binding protein